MKLKYNLSDSMLATPSQTVESSSIPLSPYVIVVAAKRNPKIPALGMVLLNFLDAHVTSSS